MPVKYIDVHPISDLFVAATRAFGDMAIVGKGDPTAAASPPPTTGGCAPTFGNGNTFASVPTLDLVSLVITLS